MRVGREEKQVPRLSCASLGMTMCQTFDARGELAGALEQRGAGAGFFCEGAREESDGGEDFKLGAGEAGFDAEARARALQEQTHWRGAVPSRTATGLSCSCGRRRSMACAGNSRT